MQNDDLSELDKKLSLIPCEDVRLIYEATYTYHHMIVQSRFNGFALYAAMTTFLLASFFTDYATHVPAWTFTALGFVLTILVYLLDRRNVHLLDNCLGRGLRYERALNISPEIGFFGLMEKQNEKRASPILWLVIASHTFVSNGLFIVLSLVSLSFLFISR